MLLFLAMMGYLLYFTAVRAKDIVNSPYYARHVPVAALGVRGEGWARTGPPASHW